MAALEPILLYDGVCAFCNGVVRFVLRHDRRGTMRFAPLEGEFARQVIARHPDMASVNSVILLERQDGAERLRVKSDAVLRLAEYVGWPWKALVVTRIIPRVLRDVLYDAFAKVRYRLFGRYETCPLPAPDARARFLP